MNYVIQVNAPHTSHAGLAGYRFAKAALENNHRILRVFFYREGIYHALRYALPPDDEVNMATLWSALARDYQLDLVVCISAAQRRGLLCADEARRQGFSEDGLADGFRIAGLGQWLEATLSADRCIVFG